MEKKGSLRTLLTVLFLVVGVIPILVVSVYSYISFSNSAEEQAFHSLGLFADLANSQLTDYFEGVENQASMMATSRDVYQTMNILEEAGGDQNASAWRERMAILDDFITNAIDEFGFARVILTDSAGIAAYDSGKELEGSSLEHRDYVQAAQKGNRFWCSLFYSDLIYENSLVFSLPVHSGGKSGGIVGVLNIIFDDKIIDRVVHEGLVETGWDSADAYLIDDQGLLHTNTCLGGYTADAVLKETIVTEARELLSAPVIAGDFDFSTRAKYKDYMGQSVLGALHVTSLGDRPVGFVVEVNEAEVFADIYRLRNIIIVLALVMAALIAAVAIWQASGIAAPMQQVAGVAAKIAGGDLTVTTDVKRNDEIGQLGDAFNRMGGELRALISQIVELATGVNSGSEAVSTASEEISSSLQEVSATINEFASNVQQLSGSTQAAAETNQDILKRADEGRVIIEKSIEHMGIISKRVQDLQEVIGRVDERSHDIGQILIVITDIADQTNLLALNAAIEAARAGEQGRGFAVVAEEVRKLAEQSAKAAAEIGELIRDTQQESKQALENMNLGVKEVQEGADVVVEAGASFRGIIEGVKEIGEKVEEGASAAEELSAGSEELAASAEEQSSTMEEVAASAEELRAAAERMFEGLGKFKYQ
ncbi:MAG: methyl-accepting chemotaxis protein [Firmicutes bacterium]|nr:methyl-accepting chemotaxis protein [Bacillota bacterium]